MLLHKTFHEIWHRGEKYTDEGAVFLSTSDDNSIEAVVKGTKNYTVSLKIITRKIKINCNCPYFTKNGSICKHIVAVAIVWDETKGVSRPDQHQVENSTVPSHSYASFNIKALYKKPLDSDLELLRKLPEETALGGYVRRHSKLPELPKNIIDEPIPLINNEIKKSLAEIKRWSQRKAFDPYFCSGEMTASFCGILRIIKDRFDFTPPLIAANILIQVQQFNRILMTELIDSSLGLQEFTEAHLEDIYFFIKSVDVNKNDLDEFNTLIKMYDKNRGIY